MKAIVNLYLAQAKTFLRDRSSGFFVLLLPVAFGVFFGLVFGGSGGDFTLRLGIANQDLGATGASLLASLTENPAIDLLFLRRDNGRGKGYTIFVGSVDRSFSS